MFRKTVAICSLVIFFLAAGLVPEVHPAGISGAPLPVEKLEDELANIEKELSDLEKEIDTMLEDLVDPKLTSLSVFFASQQLTGKVPTSIQLKLDGDPLAGRKFDETDRLVLVRGGALEVHAGIVDPSTHTITVECYLVSSTPGQAYRAAPCIGEHTEYACTGLLGMSDEKFMDLLADGVLN